jgi:sugar lactone lactonase YvrE
MLNGISTDGEFVYVNDSARKEVRRYSVGKKNEREMELLEVISLPRACDNIEWDHESGNFYLGSIGNVKKHYDYVNLAREHGGR